MQEDLQHPLLPFAFAVFNLVLVILLFLLLLDVVLLLLVVFLTLVLGNPIN